MAARAEETRRSRRPRSCGAWAGRSGELLADRQPQQQAHQLGLPMRAGLLKYLLEPIADRADCNAEPIGDGSQTLAGGRLTGRRIFGAASA
jgi:hypothetical protein